MSPRRTERAIRMGRWNARMEAREIACIQRHGDPRTGALTVKVDCQADGGCVVVVTHLTILPCAIHAVREKKEITASHLAAVRERPSSFEVRGASPNLLDFLFQEYWANRGAASDIPLAATDDRLYMTLDGASAVWFT